MLLSFSPKWPLFVFLFLGSYALHAQLKLAAVFSDNMVLQRDRPVYIWGKANAGTSVTVQFAGQQQTVTTDTAGTWQVKLQPMAASAIPQTLTVKANTGITLQNILVGDVWLCSGQSNMEYPLHWKLKKYAAPKKGNDPAAEELANNNKPANIRYIYIERTLNKIPELPTKGWITGNDTSVQYISAIGYFFAKEIYAETRVPIGIISSSWGGSRIEPWTPDWAYGQSPVFKDSAATPNYKIDGTHPGQLYKGMIEPMLPLAIKGVLWYQGESNCMIEDQGTYKEKFRLLVSSWRDLFKDQQLPFYTVQLAPYLYTARKDPKKHTAELLPAFREAQTACLSITNTGMVVTTDLADKLADIHPSYKWVIAHRLALIALAKDYGRRTVIYAGPTYRCMKRRKDHIRIKFTNTGSGLASQDDQPLNWFTIAGEDEKFVPAIATIKGNKLIVLSTEVKKPKYVRFAWDEKAQPNFMNREGLPAIPFRTDHINGN